MNPRIGVVAVLCRDGKALLIQRGKAPSAGMWCFPSGHLEGGETVFAAARRELMEETGVDGEPLAVLDVIDAIRRRADGVLESHYVLVAVHCRWLAGEGQAASDAAALAWLAPDDFGSLAPIVVNTERLARQALARA